MSEVEKSKLLPQEYKEQYLKDVQQLKKEVKALKETNNTLKSKDIKPIELCKLDYI